MKKVLTTITIFLLVLVALYVALCLHFPDYPDGWQMIHKGQSRSDVLKMNIVDPNVYTSVKMLDQQSDNRSSIIYGSIKHNLLVTYDEEMKVNCVQIRCDTTRFCPRIRTKDLVKWTPNKGLH